MIVRLVVSPRGPGPQAEIYIPSCDDAEPMPAKRATLLCALPLSELQSRQLCGLFLTSRDNSLFFLGSHENAPNKPCRFAELDT